MKEATGETSMTVITLVAIAVIGAILAAMWPSIKASIINLWGQSDEATQCVQAGGTWNNNTKVCTIVGQNQ